MLLVGIATTNYILKLPYTKINKIDFPQPMN